MVHKDNHQKGLYGVSVFAGVTRWWEQRNEKHSNE
jgi:hypothetical protein